MCRLVAKATEKGRIRVGWIPMRLCDNGDHLVVHAWSHTKGGFCQVKNLKEREKRVP